MAPHEEGHPHEEGRPHEHETEAAPATAPATSIGARLILTLVGAAAMIIGALLTWSSLVSIAGTKFPVKIFWSTDITEEASFLMSAGFVFIVLGLLVVLGAAMSTGWLSRLGAVLGIIAWVLLTISAYRAESSVGDFGIGLWVILAGAVLALVGGYVQQRPAVA